MGFEAPVSYENTWEGMKVGEEEKGEGRQHGSNTLKAGVLTGICSD